MDGAPCPECSAPPGPVVLPRLRGGSSRGLPTSAHPSEVLCAFFFFFREAGVPLLRGLRRVRRAFDGAAGPAALADSGLHRAGIPTVGEASGASPLPLQRV